MFQSKSISAIIVAALLFGCAPIAQANQIAVGNYSFENPVLNNGGYQGDGTNAYGNLPSWTINGTAGAQNFIGTGAYGGGSTLPAPAQGMQAAYVNGGDIYQDVGKLSADTKYTLTVAAGNQPLYGPGSTGTIELVNGTTDGGTVLSSTLIASQPTSSFANFSTSFTTGASVSGDLTIVLALTSFQQMNYDNVRLTATPEPSSLILCGFGAFGLFLAARRRRKA